MGDLPRNIGKPEIPTGIPISQPLMIQTHDVKNRRMQIMHVHLLLAGIVTVLVGGTISKPTLDTPTGHPHAKTMRIMVPSVALGCRCTAELSTP